jgi:hypothetical protein
MAFAGCWHTAPTTKAPTTSKSTEMAGPIRCGYPRFQPYLAIPRSCFAGQPADETPGSARETIFMVRRRNPATVTVQDAGVAQLRGQVMWTILNLLYCEYCRIRLDEMRKVGLHAEVVS